MPPLSEDSGLAADADDPTAPWFAKGKTRAAFTMQLLSGGANALVTVGPVGSVNGWLKTVPFDRAAQEDARRFTWSGAGEATLALVTNKPMDLSRESNGALAIEIDLRVDQLGDGPVYLVQACGAGCSGRVDIGGALRAMAGTGWQTLSLPLSCLAGKGVDMTKLSEAFRLSTATRADLSISRIALGTSAKGLVRCE
ncbi:hypothetical protein DBR17_08680 [Sphingomonas sp. HMWF008]|nr:hypothetical protein DBR17_08680 [Sphingomonas sp. HMWF008]